VKKDIGYNGIYKFPESMADSGISGMNKSNEGSLPGTVSDSVIIVLLMGY